MKAAVPAVRFFLADRRRPVVPGNVDWHRFLPQDRHGTAGSNAIGYGDYFEAVSRFLSRHGWRAVRLAGTALIPGWPTDAPLSEIEIFLEKHGACYHPARVVAAADGRRVELVVNVALSPEAMALLDKEVELLPRLGARFDLGYLPAVFARGEEIFPGGRRLMMFLGQWFSGFHEFHLEGGGKKRPPQLAVWAPGGPRPLQAAQCRALYRQAAAVLAGYYDVFSGEQILDWHHAAGDFIVRLNNDGALALRLVTVRRYGALLRQGPRDLESTLMHLALFLVHTTLWLRVDRCRGVGDLLVADPDMVAPVLAGIRDALVRKVQRGEMPATLLEAVGAYLGACRRSDLAEMIQALAERRPSGDSTRRIIEDAAAAHADRLQHLLDDEGLFRF
jgi:hypothetical protein